MHDSIWLVCFVFIDINLITISVLHFCFFFSCFVSFGGTFQFGGLDVIYKELVVKSSNFILSLGTFVANS